MCTSCVVQFICYTQRHFYNFILHAATVANPCCLKIYLMNTPWFFKVISPLFVPYNYVDARTISTGIVLHTKVMVTSTVDITKKKIRAILKGSFDRLM